MKALRILYVVAVFLSLLGLSYGASADKTKPTLMSFSVSESTINEGDSVTINYKVNDSGGSGLKTVELWKGKSKNSLGPIKTDSVSGDGPKEGKFTDKPSPAGTYYYGIHVLDKANNMTADSGAKSVTVKARDTTKPIIVSFEVSPGTINEGDSVTINYKVKDSGGSGLNKIELWKGKSKNSLGPIMTDSVSGDGPKEGKFTDKPSPVGTYYYGIHVLDKANNMTADSGAKSVTVKEAARPPTTGSVSGKLHKNSASGAALSGVSVTCGGKSGTTDGNGNFKLDGIAVGNTTLAFSKSGFESFQSNISIVAGKTVNIGDGWLKEKVPISDSSKPVVSSFNINKSEAKVGEPITVSYSVTDSGGSGLKQVELWRSPNNKDWTEITTQRRTGLSGNGPISGSFTDTLSAAGTYYYGAHVVDNAGNWNGEGGPKKVTVGPVVSLQTGSVTGRLHKDSASGAALSGVSVTCGGKSGTTDGNGNFKLDGIAVGNTTLSFSKSGFEPFQSNISIVAGKTVNIGDGWLKEKVSSGDTTKPVVSSFNLNKSDAKVGEPITISYSVSDSGGSGLKQVELWRSPNNKDWAEITKQRRTGLSGNGPISGSFTDTLSAVGTYYYGAHVVDNAGNWSGEGGPKKVTVGPATSPPRNIPLISCGSKWYQRYGLQLVEIEQAMRGGYSFDLACQNHDACYDDCKTPKADCDKKLRVDAEQTCGSARKGHEQDCVTDARIFFDYVSAKGDAAFLQARSRCRPTTVTGSISGKLHKNSASGAVLSGVSVTCGGKSGTTDGNGNFKLDGIAVGNTTLAFSKSGFESFQSNISIVAGKTVNIGDGWLKEKVPISDSSKPVVSSFNINKSEAKVGEPITVSYSVTDSGGSGLKQVELWRSPNNKDWTEITTQRRTGLSGNGPISGSFTDTLSAAGTYYYGAHVVDNAGNWNGEGGPKKVTVGPVVSLQTGSVTGRLHKDSASGAALSGVSVTCGGKSGTTDGNGNFKLDGIAVGNTTLSFSKSGFEPFQSNISIVAGKTVNIGDGWLKEKVSSGDTTKPVVSSFNLNKSDAKVGEPITISYSVSDSGGSGLKQVELWRSPNNKDWAEITKQRRTGLSGNGPISGSFTDTLSAAGTYYYGVHVVDNAGNWNGEGGPKKVTVGPVVSLQTGSVTGRLHKDSASGAALSGVSVTCGGKSGTTDGNGNFKLDGIAVGNTTLAFSKTGFEPFQSNISIVAGKNVNIGDGWLKEKVPISDSTKPVVSSFNLNKSEAKVDEPITISYSVSDSGGSGLKQVELWRSPNNKDWTEITTQRRTGLSGNGPISGSFTDTLSAAGTYYYGAHVVDNAGNWNGEGGPKKVTVPPPPTITGGVFPLPVKFRKDKYNGLCAYKTSAGWHTGVDIPTPNDHPMVYAVCKGVIVIDNTRTNKYENYTVYPECKGKTQYCNYWNAFIVIAHDCNEDGKVDSYAYYGHLTRSTNSNNVSKGDPIGYIRDSFTEKDIANPSNNHLHFGYNKNIKQNHWGYYGNSCEEVYAAGWGNPIGYYFK